MQQELILQRINKRNIIRLSNCMNNLRHNLSSVAIDILYSIFANIEMKDEELKTYEITIKELEKKLNRKINKVSLKNALKELREDEVFFNDLPLHKFKLLLICEYDSPNSVIIIKLNDILNEYLLNLTNTFFKVNLESLLKLRSRYSKLLYIKLCQYKNMEKVYINLEELNIMLNTPRTLQENYGSFKQRILKPTLKALNELEEFEYVHCRDYKRIKKVELLEFKLSQKVYFIKKTKTKYKYMEDFLNNKIPIDSKIQKKIDKWLKKESTIEEELYKQ